MGQEKHRPVRGDPADVTIFGESAGSFRSQYAHGRTVRARPLRQSHRESGGALTTGALEMETLAARGPKEQEWMKTNRRQVLVELRAISTDKISNSPVKEAWSASRRSRRQIPY